jgi:hypothetical protein
MRETSRTARVQSCLGALAVASAAAFGLALPAGPAQAQVFQDNTVEYRYGTAFKEPGVANGADIRKSILNFTHVDGDKWGGDFLSLDILFSAGNDPTVGTTNVGAQELYFVYRRDFSYNKLTGYKGGYGLISDFGLQFGGDLNAKDTSFGPEKRLLVVGPYIDWAMPVGFFKTAFEFCHEWNQNGIVGTAVDFDATFCFESAWSVPFKIAGHTVKFNGFFNVVAPKGRDGFGAQTKTEVLTRPELVVDVSEIFHRKNFMEVGVAYEYWLNKFGNDHDNVVGALANTPMVVGRVHF